MDVINKRLFDPVTAQYIGIILHVTCYTGMAAGNVFGQISAYRSKMTPCSSKEGIIKGMIVGVALWILLFVPFANNHGLTPLHHQHTINLYTI
jgi:hypothetical protein